MKIAFTLCSNNYLAQAKTLGDSLLSGNPDYLFIIGLVDRKSDKIDYSAFRRFRIIETEELKIPGFENIYNRYSIIELNTSVKASFFIHLFSRYPDADFILYLDPDIEVFDSFNEIEKEFDRYAILLTPHVLIPVPLDDKYPKENDFLKSGIYNLGFIGLRNKSNCVKEFLDWWNERILKMGFIRLSEGLFVDQLWINLIPVYFPEKVKILLHPGYNMAPWNLHERRLIFYDGKYHVNGTNPLLFYHFSNFNYQKPGIISKNYDRYDFLTNPDLVSLYKEYHQALINNKIEEFSKIKCFYVLQREKYLKKTRLMRVNCKIRRKLNLLRHP